MRVNTVTNSKDKAYESNRITALNRYEILDTPPDGAFDNITFLASQLFKVPIAIVSLVDTDRIWFKSHYGLEVKEIERAPGLCASAILGNVPYIINDARVDPRSLSNPLVAGKFGLQFYVGIPLKTKENFNLGTLCIIDFNPRTITEVELKLLQSLAEVVMDQMELRLQAREINKLHKSLEQAHNALIMKSTHDYLTSLWNRDYIFDKLDDCLKDSYHKKVPLSILLIDVDHFKEINDTYGHIAGDNVLTEIGKRLELSARQNDKVGRIGGDEFIIIIYPVDCNAPR